MAQQEQSFLVRYRKEIIIAIIAVLMLVFIVQNSDKTRFHLVFYTFEVSLIFLIAFFFAMGALTIWVRYYFLKKEKDRQIEQLEARIKKLEQAQKQRDTVPPAVN